MAWPTSNFPTGLDSPADAVDDVDYIEAQFINGAYDCIEKIEAKLGIDSSAVATSIDYLLKSTSSTDPGHKHTKGNVGLGNVDNTADADKSVSHAETADSATTAATATAVATNGVSEASITNGAVTENKLGTGAVTEGKIGAAAVAQAKLKTSTGEVSTAAGVNQNCTLPGGEYGFYPQVKGAGGSGACYMHLYFTDGTHAKLSAYTTNVYMIVDATAEGAMYAQQRYVTSSGEINWIFFLRDKKTKKILSSWIATDHPCFGNGGDPQKVAHPFSLHNPETDEIVCINPSNEELAEIKQRVTKQRSLLQVINEDYIVDEDAAAEWPKEEVTVGLPDGYDWQMAKSGDEVAPIKTVIPQPENVLSRKLKLKE